MNFYIVKEGFEPSKKTAAWISHNHVFEPDRKAERVYLLDHPNLMQNWDFSTELFPNQFIQEPAQTYFEGARPNHVWDLDCSPLRPNILVFDGEPFNYNAFVSSFHNHVLN